MKSCSCRPLPPGPPPCSPSPTPFGTTAATLPRAEHIGVDWPVVLFALGLSILTGIVFGLVPAAQAARTPIRESLNEESRGGSGGAHHRRIRSALVVAEIGLALVLLVGAVLLLRSFSTLTQVPPGFDPANLLVVNLPLPPQEYGESTRRAAFVEQPAPRRCWRKSGAASSGTAAVRPFRPWPFP